MVLTVKIFFGIAIAFFFVVSGLLIEKYLIKRKIKLYSPTWVNIRMIVFVFAILIIQAIYYFMFNKEFNFLEIIFSMGFLILIYLYLRFYIPKFMEYKSKRKD